MRTTRQSFSLVLACIFAMVSVLGCNNDNNRASRVPPPAVDDTDYSGTARRAPAPTNYDDDYQARQAPQAPQRTGMSSRTKKLVVLAGAAALYYLYKRHQNAKATEGVDGQYYLSKNGRVYYRDADHRAHWVTPPPGGIAVPEDEAAAYRGFQGYNNSTSG
ncbi:MAG TPA: hypothetical protein VIV40_05515, partial [Kofleriaceae bacterium]